MTNDSAIADLRHPDAEQLLRSPDPARLAYDGRDGFPRVIPIGFLWNGSAIVVCTAPTAPKVKALTERPKLPSRSTTSGCRPKPSWCAVSPASRSLTALRRSTSLPRPSRRAATSSPRSRPTSALSIRGWHGSRSRRRGHATTTLALAACRRFCVGSLTPLPADLEFRRAVLIVTLRERRRARSEEPPVR